MMNFDPELYRKALRFAAAAHHGQKVPGTELPYVIHVTEVCAEVIGLLSQETIENPNLAVLSALLHDTLEDTKTKDEEIALLFGDAVAKGVRALSKDETLPKAEAMLDSLRRIKEQPKEIWCVKLADRIVNLAPPPHYWKPEKISRYKQEAEIIAEQLGEASVYLHTRIRQKIANYQQYL